MVQDALRSPLHPTFTGAGPVQGCLYLTVAIAVLTRMLVASRLGVWP